MRSTDFTVTFWGVRGSRPVPGSQTLKYGGNTSCVQVEIGTELIILDAGTGICNLGKKLLKEQKTIKADLFITHVHWDHIQGFPFFSPAYVAGNSFTVHGEGKQGLTFGELMKRQMEPPYYPVQVGEMKSNLMFQDLETDCQFELKKGINVKTFSNNHPNGGLSYRIEAGEHSCCYLVDNEHHENRTQKLLSFVGQSDLLIYDAQYTEEEYRGGDKISSRVGWGHSNWQEGVKLARDAGIKKLILFHHSPDRTDIELDEIEREAQKQFKNCFCAREGMSVSL